MKRGWLRVVISAMGGFDMNIRDGSNDLESPVLDYSLDLKLRNIIQTIIWWVVALVSGLLLAQLH